MLRQKAECFLLVPAYPGCFGIKAVVVVVVSVYRYKGYSMSNRATATVKLSYKSTTVC